jgi:hypothetical protein
MIGYIIKKRHTAIGMDTIGASPTEIAILSRYLATPGAIFPRRIPASIHKSTHSVRYFSKKVIPLSD